MKKSNLTVAVAIVALATACTNQANNAKEETQEINKEVKTEPQPQNVDADQTITVKKSDVVSGILDSYLALKDALVADDPDGAAESGKKLMADIDAFDIDANANGRTNEVTDILVDAKEYAEHISENAGNMEHQREHLELLSADIRDLVAITGADRTLYEDFCPMYNDGEGAAWLSGKSDIRNPYYGSKMLKCGKVQTEIKVQ